MPKNTVPVVALLAALATPAAAAPASPDVRSMSALAFGPGGVLFVGDGKGGAVFAFELGERQPRDVKEPREVTDVEGQLAALLGATPADVMVHDLAVDPISKDAYLAASRGRAAWTDRWLLPNDVADASVLVKVDAAGRFSAVDLRSLPFTRAALPSPVDGARTHEWKKGVSLRTEAMTDLAFADGSLLVAGLSNEEFAATLWRVPYPFQGQAAITTLQSYHGAHGKYETAAPIRAFVAYPLKGRPHVLAAYLCTPLVTFPLADLHDRRQLRGRTVAELGSGSYPLDMVVYRKDGREKLLIANSNLPLTIVDPRDVEAFEGEIASEVPGYTAGVRFEARSAGAVQQLDNLGEGHVLVLQRILSGRLDLVPMSVERF